MIIARLRLTLIFVLALCACHTIFTSDPAAPQFWPKTLADDCLKRDVVRGETPEVAKFERESWMGLRLELNAAGQGPHACVSPEGNAFDFQIGVWREAGGEQVHEIRKALGGCALEEIWKEGEAIHALALKSCDHGAHRDGKHRWFYSWVAPGYHQLWEGRNEEGQWRFYREWRRDGQPMLSRTYWTPIAANTLERIVEQSRDGGKTWTPHVRQRFTREK